MNIKFDSVKYIYLNNIHAFTYYTVLNEYTVKPTERNTSTA